MHLKHSRLTCSDKELQHNLPFGPDKVGESRTSGYCLLQLKTFDQATVS